jgi:hypothetical protein
MDMIAQRPYWLRFLTGMSAAFFLVTACSVSMQPYALKDPAHIGVISLAVLIFAVPCAALSALIFKRSDLGLVLGSQVLTVVALASWFAGRA